MVLAHLALTDFRNFATSAIVLTPGLTIIEGKNGQGKSNLLEAAFVFGALHPLRARSTRDLVRFGAGGFRLQGTVDGEARAFAVTGDGERRRLFAGDVLTTAGRWVPWGLRPVAFLPEAVALAVVRDRESRAGVCLVGPHRDEVQLLVAGEDARRFASRGTQRTLALALRAAQAEIVGREAGSDPHLLVDDVPPELDEGRQRRVLRRAQRAAQALLTAAEASRALGGVDAARRYRLEAGRILPAA